MRADGQTSAHAGVNSLEHSLANSPVHSSPSTTSTSGHTSDHSSPRAADPPFGRISISHTNARGVLADNVDPLRVPAAVTETWDTALGSPAGGRRPSRAVTGSTRVGWRQPSGARASGQLERSAGRQPQPWPGRDRDLHRDLGRDLRRRTSRPLKRPVWVCMDCGAYLCVVRAVLVRGCC
jgi:hypothetical protein